MGITRERVRQIQNTALDKLRREFPATLFLMREMAIELRKNRDNASYEVIQ
jgi:DNA-directed RNA polymerase sigma subunit (sigma70/sigma32)